MPVLGGLVPRCRVEATRARRRWRLLYVSEKSQCPRSSSLALRSGWYRRGIGGLFVKRISTDAYQALREALAVIVWNKRPFESFLRTALRDNPELLGGLPFSEPKRVVADLLVDRLVASERKYRDVTLGLMVEIGAMQSFPNIELIKDAGDRALRLGEARRAVQHLQSFVGAYADSLSERERIEAEAEGRRAQHDAQRRFEDEIERLRVRFTGLQGEPDHQARGRVFEQLLTDLFALFDMELSGPP
jgi:histone H3/H4